MGWKLEAGRGKLEVLSGYGEMVVNRLYLTYKFKYSFSLWIGSWEREAGSTVELWINFSLLIIINSQAMKSG